MLVVVVDGDGGGLEPRLSRCPIEELDAVDVVSSALAVVSLGSLGFEELVVESIPVATTLRGIVRKTGDISRVYTW